LGGKPDKSGNYENSGALPERPKSNGNLELDAQIQRKEVVPIGNNSIEGKRNIAAIPAAQTKGQIQKRRKYKSMKRLSISVLAVLLSVMLVFPVAVLADLQEIDNDIASAGNQNTVSITAAAGDTVSTSAQIIITRYGNKHLSVGDPVDFVVETAQTTLPTGYTVSSVSGSIPSPWDLNGLVYAVGWSSITFTAPATPGNYSYAVKWQETHAYGNKLTGGPAFTINLKVEEQGGGEEQDTEPPTVTITVSDTMISEADAGGTFDVIATFSEAMDPAFTPVISFNPDVVTSGTLTFSSGAWSEGDTIYTATYVIADVNEEVSGVDVSVAGAKDLAGNPQAPDPTVAVDLFDVDTIAPVINIHAPVGTYLLNQPVLADWDVTDNGSGVNWEGTYGNVADGDPVDTSAVGQYSFYVYAEDNAGNWAELTALYRVVYSFGGFLPPLVINGNGNGLFKAGSTIPVKFQLTDYYGNPVSTASGTASINTSPAVSAPIRYDADAQQYIANLKTPKGVTGAYIVTVNLDDGTSYSVGVTLR
jgi:hypothetical protein